MFPAAGYGTRFLPATKAIPKEMLPILSKPLIQYGVEEALEANCNVMTIVTGRGKRAIEDHFDISYELEHQLRSVKKENLLKSIHEIIDNCSFTYTRQNEMKGLGHAILTAESLIGNESFGVILADDLCISNTKGVLAQMVDLYSKYKCSIVAIEEVETSQIDKYGIINAKIIDNDVYEVLGMVEKPDPKDAPSNLAVIGRYILTSDIFDILRDTNPDKKGEIQITDALNEQCKNNKVIAYKFKGVRYDCGSIDGFIKANNSLYNATNT